MGKKSAKPGVSPANQITNVDREKTPRAVQRRVRTGPVTFHIKLTEEQKRAKETALNNIVTIFRGRAGSSKSTISVHTALTLLIKNQIDKIIFVRPTIEAGDSNLGFLPGSDKDKLEPYVRPLREAMYAIRDKKDIDDMIEKGQIEILPIQFARGLNIKNAMICIDEAQNCSIAELQLITSRICDNTKVVITMDENQIDLRYKGKSCAKHINKLAGLEGVAIVDLQENFRHPLATLITDKLNESINSEAAE